ncbi:MAG TPA: ATP-binding protein [Pyrinomonadaceae bacterium]|nr:ATP-binding protein [Pyrinomonadaceae bacterium]
MNFFNTFRGRLLVILGILLIATLGIQFSLNYVSQQQNISIRDRQSQALVAGIALGFNALTASDDRLQDLVDQPGQTFLDASDRDVIKDIIIINNKWQVTDSLNPEYQPTQGENGKSVYKNLADLSDLPPLMEQERLGNAVSHFPNATSARASNSDDEAHAVPVDTTEGRWYVMVLLANDKNEAAWRAAQPLLGTLGILSLSTLITFVLVWRFTRPIANLSNAAREVAEGNLDVRVPDYGRNDEMGRLSKRFNEMTANLEKSRELEEQLQQAEKSAVIGRLGSAIAHEIRNPLNYINLTLDHLKSKFSPEDKEKQATFIKLISQVKAEVARINQQISDFLNYSRPARANLQPIDARKVIEDSLRLVEGQAAENDIKIGVVEHEDVPKIMGDPEFLRSVFNNLFINAVQSMGSTGGNLNVRITPDGDDGLVRFEVTDTGGGISEENLSQIFEPYFSTKETGTGLGLAIVQKIVDVHHGSIDVESRTGEGTKFTVKLPKAAG